MTGGEERSSSELGLAPLGALLFLLAVVGVAYLEQLQFGLKKLEGSRWWASNGRDVLNALALGLMVLGLRGVGFEGPAALCLAATQVLLLSALQSTLAKHKRQAALSVGAGLVMAAPVLLWPAQVDRTVFWVLRVLFTT